jgi:hypothetical protein
MAEDIVKRTYEPLLLHHETRLAPYGRNKEFANEEVKIARVRSYAINALVKVRHIYYALPSKHLFINEFTEGLKHRILEYS